MVENNEKEAVDDTQGDTGNVAVLDAAKKDVPKRAMDILLKMGPVITMPRMGDLIDGTVLSKRGSHIYLDLGPYGTGIIFGREYYNARDLIKPLKPNDPVTAKVVELENDEGYVELSLREAGEDKMWQEADQMMKDKNPPEFESILSK